MGLQEQNHNDDVNRQLDYFCSIEPTSIRIAIDTSSSTIAGLMVFASGQLDHLYIKVAYQGSGLGSKLLNEAKVLSPEGIELYTFQKNSQAQGFYESHGFVEIERGFAEPEDNPWASSKEELADIKYRWTS
jgi:ribosomal protein S18 acetylase RimI-like enzyme